MTRENVYEKIRDILAQQLSLRPDNISEDSLISRDLGADSLDTAEIAIMIKEEFGYDLSDNEMLNTKSVRDLVDVLVAIKTGST